MKNGLAKLIKNRTIEDYKNGLELTIKTDKRGL